jgi:hypothetical protein
LGDEIVVLCAAECRRQIEADNDRLRASGIDPYSLDATRKAGEDKRQWLYVDEILTELFDAPEKVILAAMERAADRDLIEYGVHIRGAWPTDEGEALITALRTATA